MRRRVVVAIGAVFALGLGTMIAFAQPVDAGLNLVCPAVSNPVAGQTITCTYVATQTPTTPTTTTVPATTTVTTTTAPAGRTCPALPAFPTPSCTGVPAGVSLTSVTGDVTAPAGTVIDGKRITGKVIVTGNGVTIKNSEIYGGVTNGGGHYTFIVTDSTIGAPTGCDGGVALMFDKYTATRVLIRSYGDAFRATSNAASNAPAANSLASDVLVQDSYVKLCSNTGDHSDGFQGYYGGTNVQLLHNTIDQRSAPAATAPVFNADWSKGITAKDNLLAGGSFTVRIYSDGSGTPNSKSTFTGNRIVNGAWQYGPAANDCADIAWNSNTLVTIDGGYSVTGTVGPLACK